MPPADNDALVSTEWLAAHLGSERLRLLDGSFKLPGVSPPAADEYRARHLPGAVFFDIDAIADAASPLPHMLPAAADFAAQVGALGVGDGDRVVVYDSGGLVSAGRVWWMFRSFGHASVAVLDGGLPRWLAEGRPVESGMPQPAPRRFTARFDGTRLRGKAELLANLASSREQVLDARPQGRFEGGAAEPRPGLRSGHIPGSLSLPSERLVDPELRTLLPPDRLRALFLAAGIDLARPIITTCGSGVTAGALAFALHRLGQDAVAVYDGSWSEWGLPGDTPVATGPARAG